MTVPPACEIERSAGELRLRFSGDWRLGTNATGVEAAVVAVADPSIARIVVAAPGLASWDTSLPLFVLRLAAVRPVGSTLDLAGLPDGAGRLVGLARATKTAAALPEQPRVGFLERLGQGVNATADMAIGLERAARDLPALVARAGAPLERLEAAAGTGERVLGQLGEQMGSSLVDLERALASVRRASEQLGLIAADNRRGLKEFVDRGLPNLSELIDDATRMVNELSGATRDMRQDPSRFLFGNSTREGVRPR